MSGNIKQYLASVKPQVLTGNNCIFLWPRPVYNLSELAISDLAITAVLLNEHTL